MAPLLPSPALESPSAPVGPQHAGRIWGAVKGQRRPSTAGPFPCTATLQVPRWRAHRTGWQRAGSGWLKPRPKLQRCDATLPREVVWRKFQPQVCLLSPNEPMPCSHPPWVQAEGQRVTCVTRSPTAGRRWRALCCWTWTHVLQPTQRPSDFEPVYHCVPMAKASTSHPQSQHQQHSLGPPAPQLLPPRKLQERVKARKMPLVWWTFDRGTSQFIQGGIHPWICPMGEGQIHF